MSKTKSDITEVDSASVETKRSKSARTVKKTQTKLSTEEQAKIEAAMEWDSFEEKEDTWVNWIETRAGDQLCICRILDWLPKKWIYETRKWESREYLETDIGKLAISSKGLKAQLKPFAPKQDDQGDIIPGYHGKLKVFRTGKGVETKYTVTEIPDRANTFESE